MRGPRPDSFILDFSTAFDFYLQLMYDARSLTKDLGRLLANLGVERILDCAAGSGVPSIGLREQGLPVTCSDGSPEMVERFKLNAKRAGEEGDVQCDVVDWADLDPADGTYDYVMCRGNSLVYASTWGTGVDAAAGVEALERYVERFASVVEPGGWLHVDAPQAMSSGTARTTGQAFDQNGRAVEIAVTESVIERTHSRFWTCIVVADFDDGTQGRLTFTMHSAKLTIDVLADLLGRNGFAYWGRPDLGGDRGSHPALLARRLPVAAANGESDHRPDGERAPLRCRYSPRQAAFATPRRAHPRRPHVVPLLMPLPAAVSLQ